MDSGLSKNYVTRDRVSERGLTKNLDSPSGATPIRDSHSGVMGLVKATFLAFVESPRRSRLTIEYFPRGVAVGCLQFTLRTNVDSARTFSTRGRATASKFAATKIEAVKSGAITIVD